MGNLGIDPGSPFFSPLPSGQQSPNSGMPYSPPHQPVSYNPAQTLNKNSQVFNSLSGKKSGGAPSFLSAVNSGLRLKKANDAAPDFRT